MSVWMTARPRFSTPVSTVRACLLEARPVVQVIFAVRLLAGAALATPWLHGIPLETLLLGTASWTSAVIFVYLFNGAADVVEDRASEKNRPIAQGELSRRTALRWCRGFAGAAMLGALYIGPLFALLTLALLALGYLYSAPGFGFKRHYLGAAAVTTLGGALTFLAGFRLGGGGLPTPGLLLLTAAMSAWMGGVGSVTKDFSDTRGDRLAGRRTLVVIFGIRAASVFVSGCALGVAISFALAAWCWVPSLRLSSAVLLAGSFCVAFCALSRTPESHPRKPYWAFMAAQYAVTLSVLSV